MIVAIHQPEHMPWLGLLNKCSQAEVLVYLDTVQFEKRNFQNRNRILMNGEAKWLTVPVVSKGYRDVQIRDIKISNETEWKASYLKSIQWNYSKHPYFKEFYPQIEKILLEDWEYISDLNIALIEYFFGVLDIRTKTIKASEIDADSLDSTERLLLLTRAVGGDTYIAGAGGMNYMNTEVFDKDGVGLIFNHFEHPTYTQKGSKEFVPYLSVIDALFNVGAEETRQLIVNAK